MAIPNWFDSNVYMSNKLAQLKEKEPAGNWDAFKVADAFIQAGFAGEEGAQRHFMEFGQTEDVAPNPFFNAMEYYYAKAAHVLGIDAKNVTPENAAMVKNAIKDLGMNAWSHYETFGSNEKVNPSNGFDTEKYMNAKLEALNANLAADQPRYEIKDVYAAFQASGISALEHFMTFGGNGAAGEVAQKYDPKNPTIPAEFAVDDVKKVHPSGGTGESVDMTIGVDHVKGTVNNDTVYAKMGDGLATINPGDTLDGGAGTDTLLVFNASAGNANTTAFAALDPSALKSIEVVKFYSGTTVSGLDVAKHADVKEAWLSGSAQATMTIREDQTLGIEGGQANITALTVKGTESKTNSVNLKLESATIATGVTIDATGVTVEKVAIDVSGKNNMGALTDVALTDLTITGTGKLTGSMAAGNVNLKTVTATNDGGVDLTFAKANFVATTNPEATITTGKGNDVITFTDAINATSKMKINLGDGDDVLALTQGASAFTAGSSFDGGTGKNTLRVTTTDFTNAAHSPSLLNQFKNFQVLEFTGAASKYNMGQIASVTDLKITGAGSTDVTIADLADGQEITISGTSAKLTGTMLETGKGLDLTFDNGKLAGDAAAGSVLSDLITTAKVLNIESAGATASTVNELTVLSGASMTSVTNINITGDQDFKLTTGAMTGYTNPLIIDGSEAEGKLEISAAAIITAGSVTIKGGMANDKITAAVGASGTIAVNTIDGGEGADWIVLGTTAADNVGDTVVLNKGDSSITAFDHITGFSAAAASQDILDLSSFAFTATQQKVGSTTAAIVTGTYGDTANGGITNISVSEAAATGFFKGNAVVTQFVNTDDALLVFVDSDKNGNWDATDDVILLGGDFTTETIAVADIKFA